MQIAECKVPVVAAIQRACVGGGIDLCTACDIRLCTEVCGGGGGVDERWDCGEVESWKWVVPKGLALGPLWASWRVRHRLKHASSPQVERGLGECLW